ncbi:hypothetical protein SUGI_0260790 [Cryptomeria japonica]|nr:hypothetical protein SUGI_0260790 [Cryptomeria japonica]
MKLITWNVRGINASNKQCILKRFIFKVKAEITIIQETKLDSDGGESFGKCLGSFNWLGIPAVGASGGLGIIWDPRRISLVILKNNRF